MDVQQWHILVVEDEYDSIQMVSKVLSHHGITVSVARNGLECLNMLDHFEPTLIVMDLAMPEMDGWETLVELRSNPATAHLPVVAITAYGSSNVAADALAAGFDAYYPKPISATNFVKELENLMGK